MNRNLFIGEKVISDHFGEGTIVELKPKDSTSEFSTHYITINFNGDYKTFSFPEVFFIDTYKLSLQNEKKMVELEELKTWEDSQVSVMGGALCYKSERDR